jgi:hypothetical protein
VKLVEVEQHKRACDRYVYRVASVASVPDGSMVLFVDQSESGLVAFVAVCVGLATVETYVELARTSNPYEYVGPDWMSHVVPMYQNSEGALWPNINDDPSHWNGLIITPRTSLEEARRWLATIHEKRAEEALGLAVAELARHGVRLPAALVEVP